MVIDICKLPLSSSKLLGAFKLGNVKLLLKERKKEPKSLNLSISVTLYLKNKDCSKDQIAPYN